MANLAMSQTAASVAGADELSARAVGLLREVLGEGNPTVHAAEQSERLQTYLDRRRRSGNRGQHPMETGQRVSVHTGLTYGSMCMSGANASTCPGQS
jgi:hypothetical protein